MALMARLRWSGERTGARLRLRRRRVATTPKRSETHRPSGPALNWPAACFSSRLRRAFIKSEGSAAIRSRVMAVAD